MSFHTRKIAEITVFYAMKVRRVFFNIKKAFDKVWHEGIIHKLKRNGISGNLLYLFIDFLRNGLVNISKLVQRCF